MVLIDLLEHSGIPVSNELKQDLNNTFTLEQYEKGAYFHKQGEICKKVAYLIEGACVLQYLIEGKVYVRWAGLKNTFVTSIASFFNEEPNTNEIQFLTDAKLYEINKKDFDLLLENHQAFQKLAFRTLVNELQKHQHLTDLLITTKGTERYLKF